MLGAICGDVIGSHHEQVAEPLFGVPDAITSSAQGAIIRELHVNRIYVNVAGEREQRPEFTPPPDDAGCAQREPDGCGRRSAARCRPHRHALPVDHAASQQSAGRQ
jgi:hypothetical protein